jgi:Holliday junction resolvase YEN1
LIELAEALGVEWRVAPGEAEAEAALMCKEGVVDAVVSDDVSLSSS